MLLLSRCLYLEVIEVGDAVRLRPQTYLPCVLERLIVRLEQDRSIELDLKPVALNAEAERLPFVGCNVNVFTGKLAALATDHLVEADIALKCVGPSHIVIVGVL